MVAPLLAAKAYAAVQNTLAADAGPAAAGGSDFGKLVSSAETSLQTVMAIRDQVIAAYQQIMQMPI